MSVVELLLVVSAFAQSGEIRATDCQRNRGWIPLAGVPLIVRQGERVPVRYSRTHGPDGQYPFSPECLRNWTISNPRVKMSPDHGTIIVPPDLPAGTEVTITAAYDKARTVRLRFHVLGRDEPTLAGTWSESERENCEGRRIAELVFSVEGDFSFTVPEQMVESMVTGSGRYRWDPGTGALDMGGLWQGKAKRTGHSLVIEGINLTGFQNGPDLPTCRITLSGG